MESYPGADLTTEQLLDALSRRVEQQRATHDHNAKNPDFRSTVFKQEKELSKLLYQTRTIHSSISLASSAPAEIILKIATEAQSTTSGHSDLVSMSHVCKSWREAVISYPFLWNTIYHENEMTARLCLERSKPLPLIVTLSNFGQWSAETRWLLGTHTSRFKRLHLEGSVLYDLVQTFSILTPGEGPLLLRDLALIGSQLLGASGTLLIHQYLHSPILSKDIPTLHNLRLFSFPLVPQMSVLRHLTELDLEDFGPASANTLLDVLANNPSLQKVDIVGPLYNLDSPREDLSIALPHLRSFQVCMCDAVDILRCLHIPRSEHLRVGIQSSFEVGDLPRAYQPYSVIHLAREFEFHEIRVDIDPNFHLEVHDSERGIEAGFGELPPSTEEVLGPSTVQFIKYLRFWDHREDHSSYPPGFWDPFRRMEGLETLALDCYPTALDDILFILDLGATVCRALRTLIVILPESDPATTWQDTILDTVRMRAGRGNAIWRLRVIVSSEEHIPLYSGIFDPFVQEIEIVAPAVGWEARERLLDWED